MVSSSGTRSRLESFLLNTHRFFNDTEIRSTQKQAIASKLNVHTLTVNRADQTDSGECSLVNKVAFADCSLAQVFTKQWLTTAPVHQWKQHVLSPLAVCF